MLNRTRAVPVSRANESGSNSQARPPGPERPQSARHALDWPEANQQTARHLREEQARKGGETARKNIDK